MATAPAAERKANKPDYRLTVDGEDFTAKLRPRLVSLTLTEKRGGEADQLDLVLDDSDGKLKLPRKGALIRLELGWAQGADVIVGLIDKGSFKVDEVEWGGPPDQVTIRARSADLTDAFRARKEKAWKDTTLGAIARDVAAANKLEPKIAPELASIKVKALAQHQQSDMALLKRLGREHDAVATVKDGRLILSPIGKATTASGKALPGLTLTRKHGDSYRFRELDRGAGAGVEARWHDQDDGDRKTVKVGGGKGKAKRLRKVYHSEAEARSAAQAEANRTKRAEAEFDQVLALGRPDLSPERPVTLSGYKPEADALSWIIASVEHRLDDGLRTKLTLETTG